MVSDAAISTRNAAAELDTPPEVVGVVAG